MKHTCLRQMLEWRTAIDHDWTIPAGFLGEGLKKRLPPQLWAQVEGTYVGAGLAENWETLANTMALFRQLAIEVGEQLGYAYPDDLHGRVMAYVTHIRQLPQPADLISLGERL